MTKSVQKSPTVTKTATEATSAGDIHCFGHLSGPDDAPLVVLIHYYGSDGGRMFQYMFDALRAANYKYIAPDFPGHGGSAGKSSGKPEGYCAEGGPVEIVKELLDACGVRQAVIMGYDWGGGVACAFALKYSKRVKALIPWCASVRDPAELQNLRKRKKDIMVLWAKNDSWHPFKKGTELATAFGTTVTEIRCRHKGGAEDARTRLLEFLDA